MSFTPTRRNALAMASSVAFTLALPSFAQEAAEAPQVAAVFPTGDMVQGMPDAPVEIVEYSSFTCPHCAAFHANVLPKIRAEYIETGKVRWIQREVYFDRLGLYAGVIARCGGEERYFGLAELFFEKQREWVKNGTPEEVFAEMFRIGKLAGLTEAEMTSCISDQTGLKELVENYQSHMTRDKIEATPTFMIDGEKTSNLPFREFAKAIDAKLAASN